jgi:enterochelin esterase-like enzyme
MDNLINAGKAKPMIVVMDNGYAEYAVKPGKSAATDAAAPYFRLPTGLEAFGAVVLNDLIPMIDSTYRTIPDREHRAMAGLSMGAMETMAIALSHSEAFSYIGSFSQPPRPALPPFDPMTSYGDAFADAARFNQKVHLLWFGAGTAEVELNNALRSHVDELRVHGIHPVLYESPGTAHEWLTWRRDLNEFAPLLFQQ